MQPTSPLRGSFALVFGLALVGAPVRAVTVDDDFSTGARGWEAFFVDHPPGVENDWDMEAGLRPLPAELGLPGTGFMITGDNHSDDLGMALKKQLGPADGIEPGQTYRIDYEIHFASNAPSGAVGVGGSPGDGVYLKAGASVTEPAASLEAATNHLRPTVNVGFQSVGGPAASVTGVIANGRDASAPAQFVALTRQHRHRFPVRADAAGRLWLLVMTDSAFEGPTTLHYLRIRVTLTPVEVGDGSGVGNLSTRGVVGAGEGMLIAGLVVNGSRPEQVLIRAVGPGLAEHGVSTPAVDPVLTLYRGADAIATNIAWEHVNAGAEIAAAAASVGAFPLETGSRDAALLVTLEPGAYTVTVEEADGSAARIGLVEVYRVP